MKSNLPALAALAICGGAAVPALATSEAHATLARLSYSLTDLDPSDGISPTLTFLPTPGFTTTVRAETQFFKGEFNTGAWTSTSTTSTSAHSHATASISTSAPLELNGASLSASGQAQGRPGTTFRYSASAIDTQEELDFSLSPHTLLRFNGIAAVSTTIDNANNDIAHASASMWIGGDGLSNHGRQRESFDLSLSSWSPDSKPGEQRTQPFSLRFANFSDQSISGRLGASALVWGYAVSPVPAPAAWALWIGGLVLLGTAARRRRGAE